MELKYTGAELKTVGASCAPFKPRDRAPVLHVRETAGAPWSRGTTTTAVGP